MNTPYPRFEPETEYPYSDGKPMAESDFQLKPLIYAIEALRIYFQSRADVYVAGDMFLYYEQGNPKAVVKPDVFVVFGADKHDRYSYKLWEEPKAPDFILEITSKSTQNEDRGPKRGTYALLGVKEYWLFDPTSDYLTPPLQGYRLVGENYQAMTTEIASGGAIALYSDVLKLELRGRDGVLRFYDPETEQYLLSHAETEQARQQAETRIAELEAQLKALQKD